MSLCNFCIICVLHGAGELPFPELSLCFKRIVCSVQLFKKREIANLGNTAQWVP